MSDQDSIFNSEETPKASEDQSEATAEPTKFSEADPLNEYVGEGKKFDSPDKFVDSYKAAQDFIEQLKKENAEARQQLEQKKELEEMIEELKSAKADVPAPQQKPAIDVSDIESIVKSTLSKAEQEKLMQANTTTVVSAMTEQWGDKAEDVYMNVAKENGMSVAELNRIAASAPQAVLNLVKSTQKSSPAPASSTGSLNTETLQPSNQDTPSAKVPNGASTADMIKAWKAAAPTN